MFMATDSPAFDIPENVFQEDYFESCDISESFFSISYTPTQELIQRIRQICLSIHEEQYYFRLRDLVSLMDMGHGVDTIKDASLRFAQRFCARLHRLEQLCKALQEKNIRGKILFDLLTKKNTTFHNHALVDCIASDRATEIALRFIEHLIIIL